MNMAAAKFPPVEFKYRWDSRRLLPERRGARCTIVRYLRSAWGAGWASAGDVVVRFEDGTEVTAPRYAVKRKQAQGARSNGSRCGVPKCTRPIGHSGSRGMCNLHACRARRQR
jgi:hypothetical protein